MDIKDIVNENIDQFRSFWLDWENKVKYIDLFKRGLTSGETLGLFFIKDAKAVLELVNYYKDFKKIVIYDVKGAINLLKDYDSIDEFNDPRVEYIYAGQDLSMKFDKIIMNPPYNLGNKITEAVLSFLNDNGDCVCLQPLSQYKRKDLYKYVESLELADPSLFEDASISNNLCITICKNKPVDKYSWKDMLLKSVDQRYYEFYKWNMNHNKGLISVRKDFQAPEMFNRDLDFIDTSRCIGREHGYGYHAKNTSAYKWNNFINGYEDGWLASILTIRFPNKAAKDNYCKYAYNWTTDKYACLESKVMGGLNTQTGSSAYFFWVPQIDWENISDNPLWKAGNYDEAVLSEMGLKWQGDTIVKR